MATEKIINTRIQLKYDTLENWNANPNLVLRKGEVGICAIPSGSSHLQTTPPAIMFKVGDGTTTFKALPWSSALAADVYAWAKKSAPDVNDFGDIITAARSGLISADSVVKTLNGLKGDITLEGDDRITVTKGTNKVTFAFVLSDAEKAALASGITATKVATYDGYDAKITAAQSAADDAQSTADAKYTKPTGGIPKADLATAVQTSLGKADTALQEHQTVTLASGTDNGTLKLTVGSKATDNIAVKGLGSAAYTSADAYDVKGAAAEVLGNEAQGADYMTVHGLSKRLDNTDAKVMTAVQDTTFQEFKTANTAAIADAKKAGTDVQSDLNAYKTSNDTAVNKNTTDIANLQTAVKAGITFKGKIEALPATTSYENGDLIIVGTKEYILYDNGTSKAWVELGDEGTHLTKATADGYYVAKNAAITGATKAKITYDSKGLVTGGADLVAADIPELAASKITSGELPDARIASAATWNAKQNAITSSNKLAASLVSGLATVATSGKYDDLTGRPIIENQTIACDGDSFLENTCVNIISGTNIDLVANTTGPDYSITVNGKSDDDINTMITNKINELDVTVSASVGAGMTIKSLKQVDGKIQAEFQDIAIPASKVTDFDTKVENKITAHEGVDKVGTVTSVSAGTGLKITGTASTTPKVEIDDSVVFVFNCGSATELVD